MSRKPLPNAAASALQLIALGALVCLLPGCASERTKTSPSGWVTLIDDNGGEQGWVPWGTANWHRASGALTADQGDGVLLSPRSYANFELRVEFWTERDTNSGIFIRCTNPEKVGTDSAYEVNIFDTRPDPSYGTGAIVNIAKVSPMPKAGEKWNTYEVTAKGPQMTVTLNGVRTVDGVEDTKFPSGRIALQYGAGVVKFRKVQVKPI